MALETRTRPQRSRRTRTSPSPVLVLSWLQLAPDRIRTRGQQHVVAMVTLPLAQQDGVRLGFVVILGNFVDKINHGLLWDPPHRCKHSTS